VKLNFFSKKKSYQRIEQPLQRDCEAIDCSQNGLYQAPKKDGTSNHQSPDTWHWFCLKHVRLYNQEWNYFAKMTEAEVQESWRKDVTWERPSWPLGSWHRKKWQGYEQKLANQQYGDPFGLFEDEFSASPSAIQTLQPEEHEALKLLGLSFPFTEKQLQTAYREMVKKHHPDVNQGCTKAEEFLKQINHAYTTLKDKPLKLKV
jgi:hypothetical protein